MEGANIFEQTNYMAQRCGDLYEVVEVMEQFYSIFGPELKGEKHSSTRGELMLITSCDWRSSAN